MEDGLQPNIELAKRVLPRPLLEALKHVFAQGVENCGLVGGTALAGFYAGHRRSDDLDLFARDAIGMRACTLAVRSLERLGASLTAATHSQQYFHVQCELGEHRFTVDVVEDENLFRIGSFVRLAGGIAVADLKTLLRMKAATLVSRCSEKDLYDLLWLLERFPGLGVTELVGLGREIDTGVDPESILASLGGATLREEACRFSLDSSVSAEEIHRRICSLREDLIDGVAKFLRKQPAPPLAPFVRKLNKRR